MFEEKLETNIESASKSEEIKRCLKEVNNRFAELGSELDLDKEFKLDSELSNSMDEVMMDIASLEVKFWSFFTNKQEMESFDLSRIENMTNDLKRALSSIQKAMELNDDKNDNEECKNKIQSELLRAKNELESINTKLESAKEKLES